MLKHLNLSRNAISHIDRWVELKWELSRFWRLLNFRKTFDNLSQLRQLSLEQNKLKSLDKELFQPLASLDVLIVDHNYLEDINGVFSVLSKLQYLSLVHNSIKWFDMAFFPKSVEKINLSKNMIEATGLEEKITLRKKSSFYFFLLELTTSPVILHLESGFL